MEWYGEIEGILRAKRGVRPESASYYGYDRSFDIYRLEKRAKQEVRSCLEDILRIEGITRSGQSAQLERCAYGRFTYSENPECFNDTGRIGSDMGVFDMHVTGHTQKAVDSALYHITRYLWIREIKTRVEKRKDSCVVKKSDAL